MTWWMFALLSAVAAAATAILAKIGIEHIPSNLATAIRTTVILVFACGIVAMRGEYKALPQIHTRSWIFLGLSGIATGISWLAYFRALQMAPVNKVVPIDKLSLIFTIALAALVLGESISWKVAVGALLIVAGTLLTTFG